jgi:hypothetical protein
VRYIRKWLSRTMYRLAKRLDPTITIPTPPTSDDQPEIEPPIIKRRKRGISMGQGTSIFLRIVLFMTGLVSFLAGIAEIYSAVCAEECNIVIPSVYLPTWITGDPTLTAILGIYAFIAFMITTRGFARGILISVLPPFMFITWSMVFNVQSLLLSRTPLIVAGAYFLVASIHASANHSNTFFGIVLSLLFLYTSNVLITKFIVDFNPSVVTSVFYTITDTMIWQFSGWLLLWQCGIAILLFIPVGFLLSFMLMDDY